MRPCQGVYAPAQATSEGPGRESHLRLHEVIGPIIGNAGVAVGLKGACALHHIISDAPGTRHLLPRCQWVGTCWAYEIVKEQIPTRCHQNCYRCGAGANGSVTGLVTERIHASEISNGEI